MAERLTPIGGTRSFCVETWKLKVLLCSKGPTSSIGNFKVKLQGCNEYVFSYLTLCMVKLYELLKLQGSNFIFMQITSNIDELVQERAVASRLHRIVLEVRMPWR